MHLPGHPWGALLISQGRQRSKYSKGQPQLSQTTLPREDPGTVRTRLGMGSLQVSFPD